MPSESQPISKSHYDYFLPHQHNHNIEVTMREPTTITAEQADEVVSIIKSLDVESLSTDDLLVVFSAWQYITHTLDIQIIAKAHRCLVDELACCLQRLPYDKLRSTSNAFNDTDELFTALRAIRETVETT